MIPLILLAIITIVIVSDAVIKPSIFKYMIMLFSSIFALAVGFSYYELIGGILFKKEILPNYIHALVFILTCVISFLVFKMIGDYSIRREIKFPGMVSKIGSVVFALLFSLLITGTFMIFFSMLPMAPKYPYPRFADKVIIVDKDANLEPDKPMLSPDGMVAGLFKTISAGSMSSSKSFAVMHAGFIDSLFLNRHNIKDEENPITAITGSEAIKISMKDKNVVRKAHTNLKTDGGKAVPEFDDKELYIIKCPFNLRRVESGGALESGSKLELLLCQIRILCNDSYEDGFKGSGEAVFPYAYLDKNGKFVRANVNSVVAFDINRKDDNTQDVYLAFYVTKGKIPVALAYKKNFITQLPEQPGDNDDTSETETN